MFKFDKMIKSDSTNIYDAKKKKTNSNKCCHNRLFKNIKQFNTRTWVINHVNLLIEAMSN